MNNRNDDRDVSLLAFDQYMRRVRQTPDLLEEEEQMLLAHLEQGKLEQQQLHPDAQRVAMAMAARERLVEGYQALVISIANRYKWCCRSMELLDLIQEGNLGLLKGIDHFCLQDGSPFCRVAAAWIRGSILNAYGQRDSLIRIAHRTWVQMQHLYQVRRRLLHTLEREPTPKDLARAMNISQAKVEELLVYERQNGVESLQALLRDGMDESDYDFVSVFAHADTKDAAHQEQLHHAVQHALETVLTPRQQQSMRYRFGLHEHDGTCYSASERAQLMGLAALSQSVEDTERRATKRLRVALAPLYGLVELAPVRVKKPRPSLLPHVQQRDYYTIREVCEVLQISYPTVRDRMKRGLLPYEALEGEVLKYRFPKHGIDRLVALVPAKSKRRRSADKAV